MDCRPGAIGFCACWVSNMETANGLPDVDCSHGHIRAECTRNSHTLQAAASAEVEAHFAIEDDGSFMLDVLMIEARNR